MWLSLTVSMVSSLMRALEAILNELFPIAAKVIIEYICSTLNKSS